MTFNPGENVGPYRVLEQLGSGGMATVFKAYHPALDRYVAIKVLHAAFKADPQFFERFQREARIVAKLEHPHIIPVYDFNEHHGDPYLVMRFVEGETLKHQMTDRPLPPDEVIHLMRPVCQALTYAHQQGVLHRDIKPSNIMITREGHIFVTDFGLARMVQAGESTLSQDMLVGTPQYISPEQARGMKNLDGRTDIYSLGVVLFEMFVGRAPYNADTPFAVIHDHIYAPLPLPSAINPAIDPAIECLLLKALAKDPNDRFATADELLTALETAAATQTVAIPTVVSKPFPVATPADKTMTEQKKAGRPWWVYMGGVTLILLILVGGVWLWRRTHRPPVPTDQPSPTQVVDAAPTRRDDQPPPLDTPVLHPTRSANRPTPESGQNQQAMVLSRQATVAMEQKQFEKAIELFQQATTADPHYLPAYFGCSVALQQSGDISGSVAILEEAVRQNPDSPDAYLRLGEVHLANKNPSAALIAFEQAITLAPNSAAAYAQKALALLALDRDEEAKEAVDTALNLAPLNPEARLARAIYLLKQGERRQALKDLQQLAQDRKAPPFVIQRARDILANLKIP